MWCYTTFLFVSVHIALGGEIQSKSSFLSLFEGNIQAKVNQIYQTILGTFAKFLEMKDIVKPIRLRGNFKVYNVKMRTAKQLVIHNFNIYLRESIQGIFDQQKIEEVRAEDLSMDITNRYAEKLSNRPSPGEKVATILQFQERYRGKKGGKYITAVFAYVYMEITEICENNWIADNERSFTYELRIELSGVSIDENQANKLGELISRSGVPGSINYIEGKSKITWDDL
ncbi:unnamed protein product [Adineta ricciae]|uniref:Uncharacterized protein n=1 Tax=Adineta ricciae TaxID=249248 RepID=A0A816BHD8_ADIRI|nr:unnamed protein product [Adineta ricciae]